MDTIEGRTCGNCKAAVGANVKGMEGMLWCQSGNAAAQAGLRCAEAVFINPSRPGCEEHVLRTGPIPVAGTPEQLVTEAVSAEPAVVEPSASAAVTPSPRHGKEGKFPEGFFL